MRLQRHVFMLTSRFNHKFTFYRSSEPESLCCVSETDDNFRLGIQLCDGTDCANTGDIQYSSYFGDGGDWSAIAGDADYYDPEGFRIGILKAVDTAGTVLIEDTDIRFGIQICDSGSSANNCGEPRYTPWASEGGGWSAFAGDSNYYDFDGVKVVIEQQDLGGLVISDLQVGAWATDSSNDETRAGDQQFSGWLSAGGSWADWAAAANGDDLDSIAIYLGVPGGLMQIHIFNLVIAELSAF